MGRKRKRKPQKMCAYCGNGPATTRDHVVPKCLFTAPLPSNMITVPACSTCNDDKARDEVYLRDILVMDYHGSTNPTARDIFTTKVVRSAERNRSDAARAAMTQTRFIPHRTPSGLYLGRLPSFDLDDTRISRTITYMIRGLYLTHTGRRLPHDCVFDINRVFDLDMAIIWYTLREANCNGPYLLGGDTFTWAFMYAHEEPSISMWLIGFYEKVYFAVHTNPHLLDMYLDHGVSVLNAPE